VNALEVGDGVELGAGIDVDDFERVAVGKVKKPGRPFQSQIIPAALSADDDFLRRW
jgi:hypothetical protein